jgi:surface polysaccharide O-acyltransferase-like enzyme
MIDAMRVVASFMIIWIHVPRSEELLATTIVARFAVPFFVFAAVFFAAQTGLKKPDRSATGYLLTRFRRIYVPFLLWSGVYLAMKWAKLLLTPNQPNGFPGWEVLFVGTAYHLWFLPFIFVATSITFAVSREFAKTGNSDSGVIIVVALVVGTMTSFVSSDAWNVADGFKYAWQTVPSTFWAVGFALVLNRTGRPGINRVLSPLAIMTAITASVVLVSNGRNVLLENLAGSSLFIWSYSSQIKRIPKWIVALAPFSFGIYLSHMLFIKVAEAVTQKFALPASMTVDVVVFAVTVIGSTALCWSYKIAISRVREVSAP